MPHIDPVVVGVARGGSDAAVRFAAGEARRAGQPLDLVHVTPVAHGWAGQLGQDSLHVAARRARGVGGERLEIGAHTRTGDPLRELVDVAAGAALLVLERRRPVVLRQRQASFTESVADLVDTPLASVPCEWSASSHGVITVGLDLGHADQRALRAAILLARLRGAVLRVLATTTPGLSRPRDYAEALLEQLGADACDLALEIVAGDADSALLGRARRSDLLVLGRHRPLSQDGPRLGPVSRSVVREAVCPVWLTAPGHVHAGSALDQERGLDAAVAG